ncbi:MAG: hypothetical protein QW615_05550 [Desulfurococcaceae archaeon]
MIRFSEHIFEHAIPLFTDSSVVVDYDIVFKYWFTDGIFIDCNSLTKDWEYSIRITMDKYLIFATYLF